MRLRFNRKGGGANRRGTAAVEMAIVLPLMVFCVAAGADYARVFYYATTVSNCALNGAAYAARSTYDASSPYGSLTDAALADATDLSPQPTVGSTSGVDSDGNAYVEVTVTYPFQTSIAWGMIPFSTNVSRTVRMMKVPDTPQ